eukprot:tig00000615_g2595.t1
MSPSRGHVPLLCVLCRANFQDRVTHLSRCVNCGSHIVIFGKYVATENLFSRARENRAFHFSCRELEEPPALTPGTQLTMRFINVHSDTTAEDWCKALQRINEAAAAGEAGRHLHPIRQIGVLSSPSGSVRGVCCVQEHFDGPSLRMLGEAAQARGRCSLPAILIRCMLAGALASLSAWHDLSISHGFISRHCSVLRMPGACFTLHAARRINLWDSARASVRKQRDTILHSDLHDAGKLAIFSACFALTATTKYNAREKTRALFGPGPASPFGPRGDPVLLETVLRLLPAPSAPFVPAPAATAAAAEAPQGEGEPRDAEGPAGEAGAPAGAGAGTRPPSRQRGRRWSSSCGRRRRRGRPCPRPRAPSRRCRPRRPSTRSRPPPGRAAAGLLRLLRHHRAAPGPAYPRSSPMTPPLPPLTPARSVSATRSLSSSSVSCISSASFSSASALAAAPHVASVRQVCCLYCDTPRPLEPGEQPELLECGNCGAAPGEACPFALPPPRFRFVATERLSHGAFGVTYRGVDLLFGNAVVLKKFHPNARFAPEEVRYARLKFQDEGQVLSRLKHPGIPLVLDLAAIPPHPPPAPDGPEAPPLPVLVMEHIDGEDLGALVRRQPALFTGQESLRLLADAFSALQHMHERAPPIIHRDVQPGNIVRRRRPQGDGATYALVDFGLSKVVDSFSQHSYIKLGTDFAPPEILLRGPVGPPADVYSLAATVVALAHGDARPSPAEDEDCPSMFLRLLEEDRERGLLPPDLCEILAACLGPRNARPTAAAALERLRPLLPAPPPFDRPPSPS